MLKEYQIIIPTRNKNSHFLDVELQALEADLVRNFNGFTRMPGHGAYKNDAGEIQSEAVRIYIVATDKARSILRSIAWQYGRNTSQKCVYLRDKLGNVELIDTRVGNDDDDDLHTYEDERNA